MTKSPNHGVKQGRLRTKLDLNDRPIAVAGPKRVVGTGFEPFPARTGVIVTNEEVNALREVEGI